MRWGWIMLLVGCGRIGFDPGVGDGGGGDGAAQDSREVDAPMLQLEAGQCPNGYSVFGTSCYRLQETPVLDWLAAEAACEADAVGAHLAVPIDAAELTLIRDSVKGATIADAWIGISDRVVAGTHRTVTGGIAFALWESGEPDGGIDRCAVIGLDAMLDKDCDVGNDFICEYDGVIADPAAF